MKKILLLFLTLISCTILSACDETKLAFVEYNSDIKEFDRSLLDIPAKV